MSTNTELFQRIRNTLLASCFALSLVAIGACNTTEGVGKDVEATGDAIQDAAD